MRRPFSWISTICAGSIAALGLALLSVPLADTLLLNGRAQAAVNLVGPQNLSTSVLLPALSDTAKAQKLAQQTLRNTPFSGPALVVLANAEAPHRSGPMRQLAARTGWHDEFTQRQLYNAAMIEGRPQRAMRHADALLRQGMAKDDLFASLIGSVNQPAILAALVQIMPQTPYWPREFLVKNGPKLPDATLQKLAAARAQNAGGLDREIASPLISQLVRTGRMNAAIMLWKLVRQSGSDNQSTLNWPDDSALRLPTPFDWQFGAGLRLEADSVIADASGLGDTEMSRRLVLTAGAYRLVLADAQADQWRWAISCNADSAPAFGSFRTGADFSVPANCTTQLLTIKAAIQPEGGEARMGPLILQRLR